MIQTAPLAPRPALKAPIRAMTRPLLQIPLPWFEIALAVTLFAVLQLS